MYKNKEKVARPPGLGYFPIKTIIYLLKQI